MSWMWLAFIAGAYLVGSIPFGVLIGRARGVDIRQHGSRNVGATNVWRVLGRPLGITCFLLDMLKGAVPVLAAGICFGLLGEPIVADVSVSVSGGGGGGGEITQVEIVLWFAVAVAAILGHMFSIFLRFGGGKGVATGFGAMLAMWNLLTLPVLFAVIVWYTALRLFKYVSLASVAAALSLPVWCALFFIPPAVDSQPAGESFEQWLRAWPVYAITFAVALVVLWKHRGNLARIRRGEEPKVGRDVSRGSAPPPPPTSTP